MARSLNKVQLIGNLTRDPELRYTPAGTAVCTFGLATNRQWRTEAGDMRDEAEYHRLVSWDKLAEICGQKLRKGIRTYVEGRIQTRKWTGQDGVEHTTVEIVISDMILLDSKRAEEAPLSDVPENLDEPASTQGGPAPVTEKKTSPKSKKKDEPEAEVAEDDIPF